MSASQEEEDPKKPPYDLRQEKQRLLILSCSSPPLGTNRTYCCNSDARSFFAGLLHQDIAFVKSVYLSRSSRGLRHRFCRRGHSSSEACEVGTGGTFHSAENLAC